MKGIIPLERYFNICASRFYISDLLQLLSSFIFPCSVLLLCFGSSPLLSHFIPFQKQSQTSLYFWHFLPFSLSFSSCHRLSLAERWPKLHWAVPSVSGECQTCTGKWCSASEILFRTDCCFCKLLYMVKILACSSVGGKKKKKLLLKSRKLPKLGRKRTKWQLSVKNAWRMIFHACAIASVSSLPFSWSDP